MSWHLLTAIQSDDVTQHRSYLHVLTHAYFVPWGRGSPNSTRTIHRSMYLHNAVQMQNEHLPVCSVENTHNMNKTDRNMTAIAVHHILSLANIPRPLTASTSRQLTCVWRRH